MKTREIIDYLNSRFIPVYQESYDNSGFLIGDLDRELSGILVTIDVTPQVVDEAIEKHCNLIVSHHPLIFGGLKRITSGNATGRMVMKLISEGLSVYSAHTNLDNLREGVNGILAEKLGLTDCSILRPLEGVLRKLVTYVPLQHADKVRQALFAAGAGGIGGYDCCSYNSDGHGTFRAGDGTHPFCGEIGEIHTEEETRIEVIYEQRMESAILSKLRKAHPYEEPAIDCIPLANPLNTVGAGMIGKLAQPVDAGTFLATVKETLGLPTIRVSSPHNSKKVIKTVAICGGSGSFLIGDAKRANADIYLTADLKYHDFQTAENDIILADIGHFESEQFAKELILRTILEKKCNFACQISVADKGYFIYI